MALLKDQFTLLKNADIPLYKTPKSVQQTIHIKKICEDGTFELEGNRYTRTYLFQDINYAPLNRSEQENLFLQWCQLLNTMEIPFKISINNRKRDMDAVRKNLLFDMKGDGHDKFRKAYNENIEKKIYMGRQGIMQEKYITIIVKRKTYEDAVQYLNAVEGSLRANMGLLHSDLIPLSADERLNVLWEIYHMGDSRENPFAFKEYLKSGKDFKNDLVNGYMKETEDFLQTKDSYITSYSLKRVPKNLSDEFLTEVCNINIHTLVSVDLVPIPMELTDKLLSEKYMGVENDIIKQQDKRNQNNQFSTDISYAKRKEKQAIEDMMQDVDEREARMFLVGMTVLVQADSLDELKDYEERINSTALRYSIVLEKNYMRQLAAYNTALPIGNRYMENMRTMLTQPAAALMPFSVRELDVPDGVFYGINAVSKNTVIGNRKSLINGNGFIFGIPGGGKSLFAKNEMGNNYLANPKDVFLVIDPKDEYFDVADGYGGACIRVASNTDIHINPLDIDLDKLDVEDSQGIIRDKAEYILSLVEQCNNGMLSAGHESIVTRCVMHLYKEIARSRHKYIPVMSELYDIVMSQPEEEAKEIGLSLEKFIGGGPLSMFNAQTNVDMSNRFVTFGIRDMGKKLRPVAMLVIMEYVKQRIYDNAANGIVTWLYIDEYHMLLNDGYSQSYLFELWRIVRSLGGLCTGITQHASDMCKNEEVKTILADSEFIVLLKQKPTDLDILSNVLDVSVAQMQRLVNAKPGEGLIKHGNAVVAFENIMEKDSALYQLYNTNLHEKIDAGMFG